MSRTIVLDATPLGMVCHPNAKGEALACKLWLADLLAHGNRVIVPEVADYEVRHEFILGRRIRAIRYLDRLAQRTEYLVLDTQQMRLAAELWAQVRQLGLPTAGPDSIDADVILSAQALSLNDPKVIVATSNPGHLSRFVNAEPWQNIPAA